jgi:hypothetical protein
MIIAYTVLVCVNAILLCVWLRCKRNTKVETPTFCRCQIYGRFIDSEISIDDIGLIFHKTNY